MESRTAISIGATVVRSAQSSDMPRLEPRANDPARVDRRLATDAELLNQPFIAIEIRAMEIVEQTAPLANQTQQAPPGMVVLRVAFEVSGELIDTRREDRDLYFGRAAIVRRAGVSLDNFLLAGGRERHQFLLSSCNFGWQAGYQSGPKQ